MKFPERVYTYDEVRLAKVLIGKGHRHRLRVVGSEVFKEKTREALKLVKTVRQFDFVRTYIRMIREIDGLSQLREAEAAIWANIYAVNDRIDAACFFIQKAWQMRDYIEGKAYYGHIGETRALDKRLRFLETLSKKSRDPRIREESKRKMKKWDESRFL